MLSEELKEDIRSLFNSVKQAMPEYKNRASQNKMIAEICKTLTGEYKDLNPIICVEAPTGVGKTIAYLISTLPIAKKNNKKVIIATATIALQEQIMFKDIVDLKKYSAIDFEYTLAKGRSRYLCIRNVINLLNADKEEIIFEKSLLDDDINDEQIKILEEFEKDYSVNRWNGEIDSLENPPEKKLWQKICCNRFSCSAKNCEFYNDCAFFKSRKKISKADVVITNQDLVLSDIINDSSILPKAQDCIFIFDEGHHLAEKSLSHFANSVSTDFIKNTVNKTYAMIEKIAKITNKNIIDKEKNKKLDEALTNLNTALTNLQYEENIHLFNLYQIDKQIINHTKELANYFDDTLNDFFDAKEYCENFFKKNKLNAKNLEDIQIINADIEQSLIAIINLLQNFNEKIAPPEPPSSNWIEKLTTVGKKNNYQINFAKIDIANYLYENLWSKVSGAVITSATLSTLGNFNKINKQLGLNKDSNKYLRLNSPFDNKLVKFIIAKMQFSPKDTLQHTQELAKQLIKRIDKTKATLVIFASNNQMHNVLDLVEKEIDCQILVQGQFNKKTILEKHKKLRSQGDGSIIFGLDSFAEGVDLKGDNLNNVMIAKLRFNVPTSPIEKTKYVYLESIGKNPFMEISLPNASLKLVQTCGRLIRTEKDFGTITIFDNRIVEKFYGKYLLKNLPQYEFIIEH